MKMSNLFRKIYSLALTGLFTLTITTADLAAMPDFSTLYKGFYIGVLGGGGSSNSTHISQRAYVFEPAQSGGTIYVNATGRCDKNAVAFGGIHIGYDFSTTPSSCGFFNSILSPSLELEGAYLKKTLAGVIEALPTRDFKVNLPIRAGVILVNSGLTFNHPCLSMFHPYFYGGIGAVNLSINHAESKQVFMVEYLVNHFDSKPRASDWTFAAQAKVGLRYNISNHCRLFAEYRYLYLAPSSFTFGSTVYPGHPQTSKWKVHLGNINYNMGAWGIEFTL